MLGAVYEVVMKQSKEMNRAVTLHIQDLHWAPRTAIALTSHMSRYKYYFDRNILYVLR